ncbi:hypothetical protein Glove_277g49 [Diversispora epigaea]|uniref:DNA-directed RNA polymerase II subunit RPB9 n=1 Tax=Diversispora epigaea TaxID=1348612 RepID=A0A397I6I1_9GLOM|nr:hypothetical protein Glove_277g49 [Diversispora epigaea]
MATFKYCSQCGNLLYPREDKESHLLLYACRNCIYQEDTTNYCVYRNELQSTAASERTTSLIKDIAADPTLPREEKTCSQCGYNIAVYFETQTRRADAKMTLYYACANVHCGYRWTDYEQNPEANADQNESKENGENQNDESELFNQSQDTITYSEPTYPMTNIEPEIENTLAPPRQEYHDEDDW